MVIKPVHSRLTRCSAGSGIGGGVVLGWWCGVVQVEEYQSQPDSVDVDVVQGGGKVATMTDPGSRIRQKERERESRSVRPIVRLRETVEE